VNSLPAADISARTTQHIRDLAGGRVVDGCIVEAAEECLLETRPSRSAAAACGSAPRSRNASRWAAPLFRQHLQARGSRLTTDMIHQDTTGATIIAGLIAEFLTTATMHVRNDQ
jgi:hypothetical protein